MRWYHPLGSTHVHIHIPKFGQAGAMVSHRLSLLIDRIAYFPMHDGAISRLYRQLDRHTGWPRRGETASRGESCIPGQSQLPSMGNGHHVTRINSE